MDAGLPGLPLMGGINSTSADSSGVSLSLTLLGITAMGMPRASVMRLCVETESRGDRGMPVFARAHCTERADDDAR